ncbi:ferredoxin [Kitasatospora sp. MAP12-15]|uniref:ferredoxin n=1 Tax=unclassified Kitasatospora TaxID=2633591 RepID=UPI002474ACE1|nr:ferredoxin [Kitasatospora sp. MAP12-44]MDH6114865.1 ferredoxin [Kitasatospora sp. MAP12-44]
MHVTVTADRCVGAGQCVLNAPEVFDQGEDGLVTVLRERPAPEEHAAVRLAGSLCPSRSITIHQD